MTVEHLELIVEEASMEAALRLLLPKMVGSLSFEIHSHQGKDDLLSRLPARLRGYRAWLPENWSIVVVIDRDNTDCKKLKKKLETIAADAGLPTRTAAKTAAYLVVNRLAIEELEAWYFGDWEAVRAAYPLVPSSAPRSSKYRHPDAIKGGTWEAFERLLQGAGYFKGGLAKIEAARAVAQHMVPSRNKSPSFCALRDVLAEMAG